MKRAKYTGMATLGAYEAVNPHGAYGVIGGRLMVERKCTNAECFCQNREIIAPQVLDKIGSLFDPSRPR